MSQPLSPTSVKKKEKNRKKQIKVSLSKQRDDRDIVHILISLISCIGIVYLSLMGNSVLLYILIILILFHLVVEGYNSP